MYPHPPDCLSDGYNARNDMDFYVDTIVSTFSWYKIIGGVCYRKQRKGFVY